MSFIDAIDPIGPEQTDRYKGHIFMFAQRPSYGPGFSGLLDTMTAANAEYTERRKGWNTSATFNNESDLTYVVTYDTRQYYQKRQISKETLLPLLDKNSDGKISRVEYIGGKDNIEWCELEYSAILYANDLSIDDFIKLKIVKYLPVTPHAFILKRINSIFETDELLTITGYDVHDMLPIEKDNNKQNNCSQAERSARGER